MNALPPPAPAAPDARAQAALWADALHALQLLALAPERLGGVWLRAPHGPVREAFLQALSALPRKLWRVPGSVDTSRWLGGLDLSATLHSGALRQQAGLLRQADGGLLCLPMAERLAPHLGATLAQTLDRGGVDTGSGLDASRFAVVALDESDADEAPLAPALQERLAIWLDLRELPPQVLRSRSAHPGPDLSAPPVSQVVAGDSALEALCVLALQLGIDSLRVPQLALSVAQASAALAGRDHVAEDDLTLACRLVLAPRARQWPAPAPEDSADEQADEQADEAEPPEDPVPQDAPPDTPPPDAASAPPAPDAEALQEMMVAAAVARLPTDLLQQLMLGASARKAGALGSSGQAVRGGLRGRPLPPRAGRPGGGARLHLLATLRAAAPRQRLRGRHDPQTPLRIRLEDLHLHRYQQHAPSCLILALDASGSSALHRLAEAKGAVQLLLEQSYARRDSVCVIGFRGASAQLLLPMTRSLVRARRALSGLPGGGGTPLASALQLAHAQAAQLQRQGVTPLLVVLSDGRANVTLAGLGGRVQAQAEAQHWAKAWQQSGHASLWIDTSPQADPQAQGLAQALGGRYLPMPQLQSQRLAQTLQQARSTR